jgi:LPS-assembly lipoprotein
MLSLRRQKIIVPIIFLVLISGCGFHLRGFVDMPRWFNKVAIIVQQGHRDIAPLLHKQLQAYNIEVTDEPSAAPYWLIIQSDNMQENISSVSSSTTPRQYQLVYTLRFKLQKANGVEIIPASQIIVTRQITINSDRILGSTDEEELQKSEMRRDAVIQIINRISQKLSVNGEY